MVIDIAALYERLYSHGPSLPIEVGSRNGYVRPEFSVAFKRSRCSEFKQNASMYSILGNRMV